MAFVWLYVWTLCNIVSADMQCHEQCNETYRCWGPADTDCVVCNVYLYRNGSERICVDSCDSPRLNLWVVSVTLLLMYTFLLTCQAFYMLIILQWRVERVMRNVMIAVLVQWVEFITFEIVYINIMFTIGTD